MNVAKELQNSNVNEPISVTSSRASSFIVVREEQPTNADIPVCHFFPAGLQCILCDFQ